MPRPCLWIRWIALAILLLTGSVADVAAQVSVPGTYATIQSAINNVPSGTTITVQPGVYAEALVVSIQNKSITVRGAGGAGATVVDAGGRNTTALHVINSTGTIIFEGLTFRNGAQQGTLPGGAFLIQNASPSFVNTVFEASSAFDGGGGALFNSNATFTGVTIRSNSARRFGGGLYIVSGSRPVFIACDIAGNASGTGGAGVANNGAGGGVWSHDSSPSFRGGRVRGNASRFAAGGIFHMGLYGSSFGVATMVIQDMEITDNVSTQFSAAENPSEGGGVHVEDNAVASLTRVRVLRNRANTGAGLNAYRGRYDLVDSAIEGNVASATATDPNTGIGGGIAASANNVSAPLQPATILTLTRTLVSNNTANRAGGGLAIFGDVFNPSIRASLTVSASVITGNRSQSEAGGILVSRGNAVISNSLVTQNTVAGGVAPNGGGLEFTNADVQISGTTIAANAAAQYGGGVFINEAVNLAISTSRLYDNTAGSFGGGGLFVGPTAASASVQSSIIADNTQYQVVEHKCQGSFTAFQGNTITPRSGSTDYYANSCGQTATSLTQFEGLPNTSGNDSNVPRFAHFLAAPAAGTRARLAWSVGRATSVSIGGVGTFTGATGSTDVTLSASGAYSLTATATSANGGNYSAVSVPVTFVPPPLPHRAAEGDFDGDGRSDQTVYRPGNGTWYIRYAATGATAGIQWGSSGDVPVAGDYDGDGRADAAVFRPVNGTWYIRYTATGAATGVQWGQSGDVPVPGDYDGDGRTDVAVFRPANATWYIRYTATGRTLGVQWGVSSDVPVAADYDGDEKTDIAVFRRSTGTWYLRYSSTGGTAGFQWGGGADLAVAVDYDGDRRADLAVFRPSNGTWYIWYSSTNTGTGYQWGAGSDVPVPGDFDGDGRRDLGVFRPANGTWYLWHTSGFTAGFQWGTGNDIPTLKRP